MFGSGVPPPGLGPQVVNRSHPLCPDAWWKVTLSNYGGGRLLDLIGSSHATLTNITQGPLSGWTPQTKSGFGSINFDGTDDRLTANSPFAISQTTAMSGGAWFKTTNTAQGAVMSDWNVNVSPGWQFKVGASTQGQVSFQMASATGATGVETYSTAAYNDGKWHHGFFTYDGSGSAAGILIYIDGILVPLTSLTNTNPGTLVNGSFNIGNRPSAAIPFNGPLDDIRLYKRKLSATEVRNLYENSLTGCPGLIQRASVFARRSASVSYTLLAGTGTFALTGNAALLKANRRIATSAGSYTLTGNAALLKANRRIVPDTGSYTLTGNAANLRWNRVLISGVGTFTLTGNAAPLLANRILSTSTGSYSWVGNNAGLNRGYVLIAGTGAFVLTGNSVIFNRSYVLVASTGSYTLDGEDAGLLVGRRLVTDAGAYNLTGNAAGLLWNRVLIAGTGSYDLTGDAADLLVGRTLVTGTGSYTLTGNSAPLLAGYVMRTATGSYALDGMSAGLLAHLKLVTQTGVYNLTGMSVVFKIAHPKYLGRIVRRQLRESMPVIRNVQSPSPARRTLKDGKAKRRTLIAD